MIDERAEKDCPSLQIHIDVVVKRIQCLTCGQVRIHEYSVSEPGQGTKWALIRGRPSLNFFVTPICLPRMDTAAALQRLPLVRELYYYYFNGYLILLL